MRAIIIEDEPLSVAELRTTLAEVAPQIEVVATASSVAEAAAVIAAVGHDLIFMDIHLGDGSGFDIFERTEIAVPVIFITAYDSYALKAFENKGIDYLLKPFGREDLQRAIDKLGLLAGGGSDAAEQDSPAPTQTPVYQERFLVHMGARMKSVTTAEIAYFMADGKYLHLVTHDGKDYIVDRTLTEVGEKLPPNLFFRINRRFIVAFDAIREMIRYSGSRIKVVLHPPLAEGEETFVSTDRVPDFRKWLNR
ncbi:LytTR family DNA-binding domain-containing protein [Alistipes sp.]|uniref:LytR/AlgR family response regulator transcription factor n=1 Tax=Alistipes sp. TaxID=1872444 RepID=UPI0025BF5B06|nr:LytTR family DNA-binding domain-containing protein [Alistipes sp.]